MDKRISQNYESTLTFSVHVNPDIGQNADRVVVGDREEDMVPPDRMAAVKDANKAYHSIAEDLLVENRGTDESCTHI